MVALTVSESITLNKLADSLILLEESGRLPIPVHVIIDARSVFDALAAAEVRPPTEISLIMKLCQLKEALLCHALKTLWWCDTRDMLADALNKGACSREPILKAISLGEWILEHPAVSFSEARHVQIASARSMLFDPAIDGPQAA